jgi:hypothetical protein
MTISRVRISSSNKKFSIKTNLQKINLIFTIINKNLARPNLKKTLSQVFRYRTMMKLTLTSISISPLLKKLTKSRNFNHKTKDHLFKKTRNTNQEDKNREIIGIDLNLILMNMKEEGPTHNKVETGPGKKIRSIRRKSKRKTKNIKKTNIEAIRLILDLLKGNNLMKNQDTAISTDQMTEKMTTKEKTTQKYNKLK